MHSKQPPVQSNDPRLQEQTEDAVDYNDDVTGETVAKIREKRGVNLSNGEWEIIDGFGREG